MKIRQNEPARLSLHFPTVTAMVDWVVTMARIGAFGTTDNPLVPGVRDPRVDVGVRAFDSLDERKASNTNHFTVASTQDPGVWLAMTSDEAEGRDDE